MSNPPLSNIPGAAVMSDTLDFVKSLWGSMSVPGLTAPTLSVDELDKKINDLKAVEAWLSLNMNMLRGSIQALEVQRGTIATLKSVGASMAAAVQTGAADRKSLFDAHPYASAFFQQTTPPAHSSWPARDKTPAAPASAPWQAAPPPAAAAAPAPAPAPAAAASPATGPTAASAASGDAASAAMANPTLWWNLLQDQFKQAVSTAMTSDAVSGAAAAASDAAAKFAAAAASGMQAATSVTTPAKPAASSSAKSSSAKPAAPALPAASVRKPAVKRAAKPAKS